MLDQFGAALTQMQLHDPEGAQSKVAVNMSSGTIVISLMSPIWIVLVTKRKLYS